MTTKLPMIDAIDVSFVEEEERKDFMTAEPSIYDELITEDVDFRVETRGLHTTDKDGGMHMPNHEATIRINPDGTEAPLWVVGAGYEGGDHREMIKDFAMALDKAGLQATVEHKVWNIRFMVLVVVFIHISFLIRLMTLEKLRHNLFSHLPLRTMEVSKWDFWSVQRLMVVYSMCLKPCMVLGQNIQRV